VVCNLLHVSTVHPVVFRPCFYKEKCRNLSPVRARGDWDLSQTYSNVPILVLSWVWKLVAGAKTTWGFPRWWRALNYGHWNYSAGSSCSMVLRTLDCLLPAEGYLIGFVRWEDCLGFVLRAITASLRVRITWDTGVFAVGPEFDILPLCWTL
jgi:hypothetical protein